MTRHMSDLASVVEFGEKLSGYYPARHQRYTNC